MQLPVHEKERKHHGVEGRYEDLTEESAFYPLEEDEQKFAWAVSYCDLLMVLLCFFIIFFESEELTGHSAAIIKRITVDLVAMVKDSLTPPQEAVKPGVKMKVEESEAREYETDMEQVSGRIKPLLPGFSLKIIKENMGSVFVINFPKNIYKSGQYKVNDNIKHYLDMIVKTMVPYIGQVIITFVGHTDTVPMKEGKEVIDTNLILSNLRASKAMEYVIRKGHDPDFFYSRGSVESTRATRSLSIHIREIGIREEEEDVKVDQGPSLQQGPGVDKGAIRSR